MRWSVSPLAVVTIQNFSVLTWNTLCAERVWGVLPGTPPLPWWTGLSLHLPQTPPTHCPCFPACCGHWCWLILEHKWKVQTFTICPLESILQNECCFSGFYVICIFIQEIDFKWWNYTGKYYKVLRPTFTIICISSTALFYQTYTP